MAREDAGEAYPVSVALKEALARGSLPGEGNGFTDEEAAAAAEFVGQAAAVRLPGTPAIAIESEAPLHRKNGARGRRTIPAVSAHPLRVAIVNDDMPFLVDSIANCLAQQGLVIQRLMHPVLSVDRDAKGRLLAILPPDSPGARRESII